MVGDDGVARRLARDEVTRLDMRERDDKARADRRTGSGVLIGLHLDLLATRDLVRQEQPDDVGVSVAYPLPGTKFHARVRTELGKRQNWRSRLVNGQHKKSSSSYSVK